MKLTRYSVIDTYSVGESRNYRDFLNKDDADIYVKKINRLQPNRFKVIENRLTSDEVKYSYDNTKPRESDRSWD